MFFRIELLLRCVATIFSRLEDCGSNYISRDNVIASFAGDCSYKLGG